MSATTAQLRGWKEPLNRQIGSAVSSGLVLKLSKYLGEGRISDLFGEAVDVHHSGNVQSFHKDRLVLADDLGGEFLNRISPGIAHSGVKLGELQFCLASIVAPFNLARKTALKLLQSFLSTDKRLGVFKFLSLAGRGESLDPNVNADFGLDLFKGLDFGLNKNADEVTRGTVSADRDAQKFSVLRQGARPGDIQRLVLFGKSDPSLSAGEGARRVAGRLSGLASFILRILRSFLKEGRKSGIQIAERLLKDDAAHFAKEVTLFFFFQFSQHRGCGVIVERLLFLLPGGGSPFKPPVPDVASATESSRQLRALALSRKESVFEGFLNYHAAILHQVAARCKRVFIGLETRPRRKFITNQTAQDGGSGWSILFAKRDKTGAGAARPFRSTCL